MLPAASGRTICRAGSARCSRRRRSRVACQFGRPPAERFHEGLGQGAIGPRVLAGDELAILSDVGLKRAIVACQDTARRLKCVADVKRQLALEDLVIL